MNRYTVVTLFVVAVFVGCSQPEAGVPSLPAPTVLPPEAEETSGETVDISVLIEDDVSGALQRRIGQATIGPLKARPKELRSKSRRLMNLHPASRAEQRTISPGFSLTVDSVLLLGSGPNGSSFEVVVSPSGGAVEGILPGDWTITAEAYSAESQLLGSGTVTQTLDRQSSEVHITISPGSGDGTLEVTLTWDDRYVVVPVLEVAISPADGGTPVSVPCTMDVGQGFFSQLFPAGFYTLTADLYDDSLRVGGCIETVCILEGETSTATRTITVEEYTAAGGVVVQSELMRTLELQISGVAKRMLTDRSYILVAEPAAEGVPDMQTLLSEGVCSWYINGSPLQTGEQISLTPSTGLYRVDLTYHSFDGTLGGSVFTEFRAFDPILYGGYLYLGAWVDGEGGTDGLFGVRDVAIDDLAGCLYTAGYGENEVGVFSAADQESPLQWRKAVGEVEGKTLSEITSLCVLPGGDGLLLCSKGLQELLWLDTAGGLDPGVPEALIGSHPTAGVPEACAISPDGAMVYVTEPEQGAVEWFSLDTQSGTMAQAGSLTDADLPSVSLLGASSVAVDVTGGWVAVCSYDSDTLILFFRDVTSGALTFSQAFTDELDGVTALNGVSGAAFSPSGEALYAVSYYDDAVLVWTLNGSADGWDYAATYEDGAAGISGLHGARDLVFTPDGTRLFVVSSGDDAVTVFDCDPVTAVLSWAATAYHGEDGMTGLDGVRAVALSEDGCSLYTAASNDNALSLFYRE